MQVVEKNALVAHTVAQMFALVYDIESYPRFLPWCSKSEIHSCEGGQVVASLYINYFKIRQHFTTRNTSKHDQAIVIELVEGPFDYLHGGWHFQPLSDQGCKVTFRLAYQFSSGLLEKTIGPVFGLISGTLVDAFIKEADKIYAIG